MSRLIAINPNIKFHIKELLAYLSHIGQNKSYFLAQLPSDFKDALLNGFEDNLEKERIKVELNKLIQQHAIFRSKQNPKITDFNKLILDFYKNDKRLELALSDQDNFPPTKDTNNFSTDDFQPLKSLRLEEKDKYNDEDIKNIIQFFSLHFQTASKIIFVGRYFQIFNTLDSQGKKENFYFILDALFNFFKDNKNRCEEISIFCLIDDNWKELLRKHEILIIKFFKNLQSKYKLKYGIKYIFLDNKPEVKKKMHDRFILTNYAMFSLGCEFSNKIENTISHLGDNDLIQQRQNFWQSENLNLPIYKIIHI